MNTTDERMMILRMIESGKVSADEGAKLLSSVSEGGQVPSTRTLSVGGKGSPKWFRVRVTDTNSGKSKATVSLPIGLMDWGLRVGAQFAPEIEGVDLTELSEILLSGADGKIIDVFDDEDGEHVEIFIE
jgi:hypothetical protein